MNRFKIFLFSQLLVLAILGITFSTVGVPDFFGKSSVDDRFLENQNEKISFTGAIVSEDFGEKGKFLIKNEFGKEFVSSSKNLDLNNFFGLEEIVLEGEILFEKNGEKIFDVKKISLIEEEILEVPKKFFLENKFGGYGFEVDENVFLAVKGGSKTFLRNGSGEVILKFFSYDFAGNGDFFSDGGVKTEINGFSGEMKILENGQEIFLKNQKKSYGVLIQTNYGKNGEYISSRTGKNPELYNEAELKVEDLKQEIYNFLNTFYFIEKEKISKEKCGGKENLVCEEGYFCELFSTEDDASGRCVEL